jgi:sugar O-acyltransferase (sialic acid O-acetyltransferase NeuD family)
MPRKCQDGARRVGLCYRGMVRLAIFGTGGMGRELFDIAERAQAVGNIFTEIVFVVDQPNGPVLGVPTIGPDDLLPGDELILGVGSSEARRMLAERFSGQRFASLVAVSSLVSPSAEIGEGAAICEQAFVSNSVRIGRHFQANVFSQISHDCVIGDFVTVSPRASINGWVEIGDDVFIGAGAIIRNGSPDKRLKIGRGATIAMGAVVVVDVPEGATVMGCPARPAPSC